MAGLGLGQIIGRAGRQGVEGRHRSFAGVAAEDQDRQLGVPLADGRDRGQPVHDGHLQIKDHHVHVALLELRQAQRSVRGKAGHRDPRILGQRVADQPPHHDGVIDDQNTRRRHEAESP
jgi:hypothetical protein